MIYMIPPIDGPVSIHKLAYLVKSHEMNSLGALSATVGDTFLHDLINISN